MYPVQSKHKFKRSECSVNMKRLKESAWVLMVMRLHLFVGGVGAGYKACLDKVQYITRVQWLHVELLLDSVICDIVRVSSGDTC